MFIHLFSHHNLAIVLLYYSPQSTPVIAFLCGTLKKDHFCSCYNLHNSGDKKQSTQDSEDVTMEISRRNKDGSFLVWGCMLPNTTVRYSTLQNFHWIKFLICESILIPTIIYFSSDIKIIHVSEFFMIFSVFFWDLNSLIIMATCNHRKKQILLEEIKI